MPPRVVSTIPFGRASLFLPSIPIFARWSLAPGYGRLGHQGNVSEFPVLAFISPEIVRSGFDALRGKAIARGFEGDSSGLGHATDSLDKVCHGVAILSVSGCTGRIGGRRKGPIKRVPLGPSPKPSRFGQPVTIRGSLRCTRSEVTAAWLQTFSRMLTTSTPVPRTRSWIVSRLVGDVVQ